MPRRVGCVMADAIDRLRILHVSDPHCAWPHLAAIARIAAQGQHDCVVLTGDLAMYDHVKGTVSVKEAEADAHSVLQALEAGHDLPVYFLPGNRTLVLAQLYCNAFSSNGTDVDDAPTLMSLPTSTTRVGKRAGALSAYARSRVALTHPSVNVHGQSNVIVAPGLIVCGLGGAVPAVQNGYIVWEGFPYTEHQVRAPSMLAHPGTP